MPPLTNFSASVNKVVGMAEPPFQRDHGRKRRTGNDFLNIISDEKIWTNLCLKATDMHLHILHAYIFKNEDNIPGFYLSYFDKFYIKF
jgi:hypothetical protein